MKRMFGFLLMLGCAFMSFAQSSPSCACCSEPYGQFDFWLGKWVVEDTLGNQLGTNHLLKMQDNCVMQENWASANSTGTSYNYYNAADSTWNQLWVDNNGSVLVLKGQKEGNRMVMQSDWIAGQRIAWYRNRITWVDNPDGTVTQIWEILSKEDKVLQTAFYGIYRKEG